jgi:hypothetical protein
MATPLRLQLRPDDPANVLAPIVQDYREHFEARCYQAKRVRRYVASVFHFGDWLRSEDWAVQNVDEAVVGRFNSDHLPRCTCPRPVQRNPIINKAALNHLIRILYAKGIIRRPVDRSLGLGPRHARSPMPDHQAPAQSSIRIGTDRSKIHQPIDDSEFRFK